MKPEITRERKCIAQLIRMYKAMPFLWNRSHENYDNRNLWNGAYDKLAGKLREIDRSADRYTVSKKIKNLRATFKQQFRRCEAEKLKGNTEYRPKLWYYDLLLFASDDIGQEKRDHPRTFVYLNEEETGSSTQMPTESDMENYEIEYLELPSDVHLKQEIVTRIDDDKIDIIPVKTEFNENETENEFDGVCQCCLNDTSLKAMLQPRYVNGKMILYAEMLQTIYPKFNFDGSNGIEAQYLICDPCIEQLQVAVEFMEKVENAQKLLNPPEYDEDEIVCEPDNKVQNVSSEKIKRKFGHEDSKYKIKCGMDVNKIFTDKKGQMRTKHTRRRINLQIPKTVLKNPFPRPEELICEICNVSFTAYFKLCRHMADHYPNFTCDSCGRNFVTWNSLRSHIKLKHENCIVKCKICSKTVKKTSLRRHLWTHTEGGYKYKCGDCRAMFSTHQTKVSHMIKEHGRMQIKYTCETCGRTFTNSTSLLHHMRRIHLKEHNVPCKECDKMFYSKSGLKRHMVRHTGTRNFACSVCLKLFSSRSALRLHLHSHSPVKRFACNECAKRFTYKCSLVHHARRLHSKNNRNHRVGNVPSLTVTEEPDEELCYVES